MQGWGFYQYVTLICFHASSLPCLHTFWHAIPTAFYILKCFFYFLVYILYVSANPTQRLSDSYPVSACSMPFVTKTTKLTRRLVIVCNFTQRLVSALLIIIHALFNMHVHGGKIYQTVVGLVVRSSFLAKWLGERVREWTHSFFSSLFLCFS